MTKRRICPECGEPYSAVSALSRKDGKTEICPDCGTKQALDSVRDLLGQEMTDQQWEGYKNGLKSKESYKYLTSNPISSYPCNTV